jgi:hypothetical protein
MKKLFIPILTLGLLGCAATSKVKTTDVDYIRKTGVISHPILAEVEIKKTKIEGIYVMRTTDFSINREYGKNMAIADAIQKNNADYLVHPMFDITHKGTKSEIKVHGYPGIYTNFRNITEADTTILKMGFAIPIQVETGLGEVKVPIKEKKRRRK